MPPLDLSPSTRWYVNRLFGPGEAEKAAEILINECGSNLPLCKMETPAGMERIRAAVLKLSRGDLDKLIEWVDLAKADWRDVLLAAESNRNTGTHTHRKPGKKSVD
jgi:hypothetical protein